MDKQSVKVVMVMPRVVPLVSAVDYSVEDRDMDTVVFQEVFLLSAVLITGIHNFEIL